MRPVPSPKITLKVRKVLRNHSVAPLVPTLENAHARRVAEVPASVYTSVLAAPPARRCAAPVRRRQGAVGGCRASSSAQRQGGGAPRDISGRAEGRLSGLRGISVSEARGIPHEGGAGLSSRCASSRRELAGLASLIGTKGRAPPRASERLRAEEATALRDAPRSKAEIM